VLGDLVVAPGECRVEEQCGLVAPFEDVGLPPLGHAQQLSDHGDRELRRVGVDEIEGRGSVTGDPVEQ
jgi:hypothetical protein